MAYPTEVNAVAVSPTTGFLGTTTPTQSQLGDQYRSALLSIRDKIDSLATGTGTGVLVVAANDAPAKWKSVADYQCTGSGDQTKINTAITALGSQGGIVQLSPGTFNCSGAVQMRLHVWLRAAGRHQSILYCGVGTAWAAYDATTPGAVIEPVNANQDFFEVSDMYISGNGVTKCIYDNSAGTTQTGWDSADATHYYHGLFMNFAVSSHMHLATFRGARVDDCKIFSGGSGTAVDGFRFELVDSFFTALDAGGCSGNGFLLATVNCRFSQCKSWFSGLNGYYFQSTAVRNQMVTCEAQDNTRNGFLIEGGFNNLNGCQADSNSYDGSPSGAPTGRTYMGFRVSAYPTMIVGSMAYDKNEGARGPRQVYGVQVDAGIQDSTVEVYTSGNFTGGANLVATFNTSNQIRITGQSVLNLNPGRLVGTATYDPPSLANAAVATTTVTVTGAAVGDAVVGIAHTSVIAAGWTWRTRVSAANTVSVELINNTGGTVDLASGTLTAIVAKNT